MIDKLIEKIYVFVFIVAKHDITGRDVAIKIINKKKMTVKRMNTKVNQYLPSECECVRLISLSV